MPPKSAMRRGARRGRVKWAEASPAEVKGTHAWQCQPDLTFEGPSLGPQSSSYRLPALDSGDIGVADQGGQNQEPPPENLRIRSAEGHIFEVPALTLWRSSLIRSLVDDSGPHEEIPLPSVTTRAFGIFLAVAADPKQDLGPLLPSDFEFEVLSEVVWVARLLELRTVLCRPLAQLMETDADLVLYSLPLDMRLSILEFLGDGKHVCSPRVLRQLQEKTLVAGMDPSYFPSIVQVATLYLGHSVDHIQRTALAALQAIPTLDAQLVLLTHKEFCVRMTAIAALAQLPQSSEQVQRVVRLVESGCFQIREVAAMALAKLSPPSDQLALEALGKLLADPVREVREAATSGFRQVARPDDPTAIAIVLACVAHSEWPVQCVGLGVLPDIVSDPTLVTNIAEQVRTSGATFAKIAATKLLQAVATSTSRACHDSDESTLVNEDEDESFSEDDSSPQWRRPLPPQQQRRWHSEASDDDSDDEGGEGAAV